MADGIVKARLRLVREIDIPQIRMALWESSYGLTEDENVTPRAKILPGNMVIVNVNFVSQLDQAQKTFLILHEAIHQILRHGDRFEAFARRKRIELDRLIREAGRSFPPSRVLELLGPEVRSWLEAWDRYFSGRFDPQVWGEIVWKRFIEGSNFCSNLLVDAWAIGLSAYYPGLLKPVPGGAGMEEQLIEKLIKSSAEQLFQLAFDSAITSFPDYSRSGSSSCSGSCSGPGQDQKEKGAAGPGSGQHPLGSTEDIGDQIRRIPPDQMPGQPRSGGKQGSEGNLPSTMDHGYEDRLKQSREGGQSQGKQSPEHGAAGKSPKAPQGAFQPGASGQDSGQAGGTPEGAQRPGQPTPGGSSARSSSPSPSGYDASGPGGDAGKGVPNPASKLSGGGMGDMPFDLSGLPSAPSGDGEEAPDAPSGQAGPEGTPEGSESPGSSRSGMEPSGPGDDLAERSSEGDGEAGEGSVDPEARRRMEQMLRNLSQVSQVEFVEAEGRRILMEVMRRGRDRSKGNAPGWLDEFLDRGLEREKIPWDQVLEDFLARQVIPQAHRAREKDEDWSRKNRRVVNPRVYMPKTYHVREVYPILVIARDTSGSMSSMAVTRIAAEACSLVDREEISGLLLIDADFVIQGAILYVRDHSHHVYFNRFADVFQEAVEAIYGPGQARRLKELWITWDPEDVRKWLQIARGRGGTSFQDVFRLVKEIREIQGQFDANQIYLISEEALYVPCGIIYFTDLMGDMPEPEDDPHVPTLWVVDMEAHEAERRIPFGDILPAPELWEEAEKA